MTVFRCRHKLKQRFITWCRNQLNERHATFRRSHLQFRSTMLELNTRLHQLSTAIVIHTSYKPYTTLQNIRFYINRATPASHTGFKQDNFSSAVFPD